MCGPYMGAVLYISQVYHTPAGVAIAAKMRYNIIYVAALCRKANHKGENQIHAFH